MPISLPDLAVAIAMAIQGIAVGFYLMRRSRIKRPEWPLVSYWGRSESATSSSP